MTTTITAEEKRHILCYLKQHKIPKSVVGALAGINHAQGVDYYLREHKLTPALRGVLIKIGAIND